MLNIKGLQLSILNFSRPSLCDDIRLGKNGQQLLNLLESFNYNFNVLLPLFGGHWLNSLKADLNVTSWFLKISRHKGIDLLLS